MKKDILILITITIIFLLISFYITAGVTWLLLYLIGLSYIWSWKISLFIWLILIIIKSLFKGE